MKKLITAFILAAAMLLPQAARASELMPENELYGDKLRVGLTTHYGNLWSVSFLNSEVTAGFERNGKFYPELTLRRREELVVMADSKYYVETDSFGEYREALDFAEALRDGGYAAVPALLDVGEWSVYAGGYDSAEDAQAARDALGGELLRPGERRVTLAEDNVPICVFDSDEYFPQFAPPEDERINLGEREYRGRVEIMRTDGQNLTAVNVIGMEEYLYSVVPSEIPPTWHREALKAQSVASRSYTLTRRTVHNGAGYDLCDAAHCQVYHGTSTETDATTDAVNATADELVWHGGKVASAVYFSSSGGFTEDSENVWANAEPFLRGVAEETEYEPKVWTRTFTLDDIQRALDANNSGIGRAVDMYVGDEQNGRVQELVIEGSAGTEYLEKEEIRTFFGSLPGGALESRNFTLGSSGGGAYQSSPVSAVGYETTADGLSIGSLYALGADGLVRLTAALGDEMLALSSAGEEYFSTVYTQTASAEPGTYVINGAGSGHGVGMSQRGAQGLAGLGWDYKMILNHYYTDVEIHE